MSVIVVPAAVPAITWTTKITVPLDPAGAVGAVQVVVLPAAAPTAKVGVQVVPPGTVIDTNVVFAGTVSTRDGLLAVPVPTLVATCV